MTATGGTWRLVATAGLAALLTLFMVSTAEADRTCVKACGAEKAACKRFFVGAFTSAKLACKSTSGAERRQCISAATRDKKAGLARCNGSFKSDCKPCCNGSDPASCSVRVCGDGQQVAGEECEPPGSASCDDQCRVVTTTSTMAPSTSTATTSTSTSTSTSTTTTTLYAGMGIGVEVSAPANGTHFGAGEAPVVRVLLADDSGNPLSLADLSVANLYMYGPQDQANTTTAVALLRASVDRNRRCSISNAICSRDADCPVGNTCVARPHHYIDLKTNPDVVVSGNVVSYPLSAVSTELPGTYTAAVWAVRASDGLQQWMPLADCQIGTAVAEAQIVGQDKCASCHLGASNEQFYMHHVDPGFSPTGNPALDSAPVRNCKACHNQDGYAAYNNQAGGIDANVNRTPDPIVRRVHGVHMGEGVPGWTGTCSAASTRSGLTCTTDDPNPTTGCPGATFPGGCSGLNAGICNAGSRLKQACTTNDTNATTGCPGATTCTEANPCCVRWGGPGLQLPFNTEIDFKDYTEVVFPADVRDCTRCHADDRWKTNPSRQACGTCHDNVWFGDPTSTPADFVNHARLTFPPGFQVTDDTVCGGCHVGDGKLKEISAVHKRPPASDNSDASNPPLTNRVDISLTPPSDLAHPDYYVAGDAPLVTVVIRNDAGDPIDHTDSGSGRLTSTYFSTAALFVNGNRASTVPVLTNAALYGPGKIRASVSSTIPAPWTFEAGDTFKIAINGAPPVTLAVPVGLQKSGVTQGEVATWLTDPMTGLGTTALEITSSGTSKSVNIKTLAFGEAGAEIDIYNSPVTTKMGWKSLGTKSADGLSRLTPAVTQEPQTFVARAIYPSNSLMPVATNEWNAPAGDPAVDRTHVGYVTYQLNAIPADMPAGTYTAYVWAQPKPSAAGWGTPSAFTRPAIGLITFQVGTATQEKMIATNCVDCHGDTLMHTIAVEANSHTAPFDTDWCKACHDYGHSNKGDGWVNQGGTSENGWSGFGASPIARRVHGVHFGRYLAYPKAIYSGQEEFEGVIFPQDVRNCVKCHSETTDWNEKPSRLACLACHDSDEAQAHGTAMTVINDPADPYGPSAIETCKICHGADAPWAAAVVHNIADPYTPPYPRDPE